ncbi:MAG TPA: adenylyl-sulfate kinase [Limnobacter sp.]|nr:adenylyl-sulfate kinase [Limnobacter sp.]
MLSPIMIKDRHTIKGHGAAVVWLTGLSGAGKSTIARALEEMLILHGVHTMLLDGDSLRTGLNADLGFSRDDRANSVLRAAQVASLMVDAGLVVIVAMISPFESDRLSARRCVRSAPFLEVHVDAPLEVCEGRDPKGLYKRARGGEIKHFTGLDSPYESPSNAEIVLRTHQMSLQDCLQNLLNALRVRGVIPAD